MTLWRILSWLLLVSSLLFSISSLAYAVLVMRDKRKTALRWCSCSRCGLIDADYMDVDGIRHAQKHCTPVVEWLP